ncbi:MAG TPA: bifunctional glutamate N-acetyltransferase/amino-acid acetyltransferase ArgJ [Desulfobacteria bacterium]|nr:bifunctional glutamate N-acetyltransferase/amino-acid acetyltransferase ArgJ [Desulfobacteria bacterium]
MQLITGGVCAAKGFKAGAAKARIKQDDKYDIAVIVSQAASVAAGVFTTNKVQAAPVTFSKQVVAAGTAQAIVVNSGNANACTGEQGIDDCQAMAGQTARALAVQANQVIVASTGVIGVPLPIDKILPGISQATADASGDGDKRAAQAIMTTDTYAKEVAVEFVLGGKRVRLGGIAKGSGMIHPNMATMLGFITTDANISRDLLQQAVSETAADSFNMITVDGDTSTNDMLIVLANGLAGNRQIATAEEDFNIFKQALNQVCRELARLIARDGEGATKFLEITVEGAQTAKDARLAAKAICGSNLVKAAFYGEDANWGRIICALGYSQAEFDPSLVDIYLGSLKVAENGAGLAFSEEEAKQILSNKDVKVKVALHQGNFQATAWGCDLSHEYVTINGSYRS